MLVVFGGLPGTGKTTLAKALARQRCATYLRIDEIEQTLRSSGIAAAEIGPAGYLVANALAQSNLANGNLVVADCVNPVHESREGWRKIARRLRKPLLEIEVVCSDPAEHRRRVEGRQPDIEGHELPTWQSVMAHEYLPWTEPHLVVDAALLSVDAALEIIKQHMG